MTHLDSLLRRNQELCGSLMDSARVYNDKLKSFETTFRSGFPRRNDVATRNELVDGSSTLVVRQDDERTREWFALCRQAQHKVGPQERLAILAKLTQIVGDDVLKCGRVSIDMGRAEVRRDGRLIELTQLEFQLLRFLVQQMGTPISRGELLRSVWGYESATVTRTVEVHIHHLRQKLEQDVSQPKLIVTVPRRGYKFAAESAAPATQAS